MSAFMIDRQDYLAFAVQLHRFCNAPMPPHYTLGAYVNHGSNDKPDWSSHT
ncbi:hypothetical protein ACK31Z_05975 [Aeromonas dhakensis]|uniref:hypothetical protein n=1 Tax=Aeromonas TaxID=642 RepID=UPI0038D02669